MFARAFLLTCLLSGLRAAAPPGGQWLQVLRSLVEDCPRPRMVQCARRRALGAVDEILDRDVVPLLDGLEFVKLRNAGGKANATDAVDVERKYQVEEKNGTWSQMLTSRLIRLLKTHVIKIDIDRLRPTIIDISTGSNTNSSNVQVESRGRKRRRHHMHLMPIMMGGIILMGVVLIPMSFQFLAVLGGKALILSKMALMMSSIQGLKKIATNGVNYGLYHTPVPEVWHERATSQYDVPYAGGYYSHFAGRSSVKSA